MKQLLFYGLTLSGISILTCLFIGDYRGGSLNLKRPSSRIRVTALALFFLLSVIDICTGPERAGAVSPLLNLQMSGVVLLFSPHSYMKKNDRSTAVAYAFAAACLLTALPLAFVDASVWKPRFFAFLAVSGLVLYNYLCLKRKYANVKALFQNRAVWYAIEDYASHCYDILLTVSICLALLPAFSQDVFSLIMIIPAAAALFAAVYGAYRKSADSAIVYLSATQRSYIENVMSGNVVERTVKVQSRMKNMYDRIVRYLQEKQPYLSEDFTIVDLSDAMFSNRVYISRTINMVTGNNFRNLINGYRVEYSQMLWKKNPKLRLKEIYASCGFHSDVSFINAFKVATGYTPVEWLKETQVEKLSGKSSEKELAA
jgi:AraC-like DNA-binding protein